MFNIFIWIDLIGQLCKRIGFESFVHDPSKLPVVSFIHALVQGGWLVAAIITELRIEVIEVVINIKGDHKRVRATRIFPLIAFHVV